MPITVPYCQEDSGGPLDKGEALKLLKLMMQRMLEQSSEHSGVLNCEPLTKRQQAWFEDYMAFQSAGAHEQALCWAIDVLERTVFAPETAKKAIVDAAEQLERIAEGLRRSAAIAEKAQP